MVPQSSVEGVNQACSRASTPQGTRQGGTYRMGTSMSRRAKLASLIVLSSLLIVTVLFNSASEENIAIANEILNRKRTYPTQDCKAEWFPPRHWTLRQSTHSPPSHATYVSEVHMFGTLEAQHAIWNHQHPSSCHDKKFLIYEKTMA